MHPIIQDLTKLFTDLVLPVRCVICKKIHEQALCQVCLEKLQPLDAQICIVCKNPSNLGVTHTKCKMPFTNDLLFCGFSYKHAGLKDAIVSGKYYGVKEVFSLLGEKLAVELGLAMDITPLQNFFLVPLPLHKRKRRWRGFNQSELIVNSLATNLQIPIQHALEKHKATKVQKDLKREDRLQNMRGCFKISPKTKVRGQNFLLVDDVITTGSSLTEAAKTLKRAGANKVYCLAVARE
jgi:ComF family protein